MHTAPMDGPARKTSHPDVVCHCERQVVRSTWDRIAAGEGETCGAPDCAPPTP